MSAPGSAGVVAGGPHPCTCHAAARGQTVFLSIGSARDLMASALMPWTASSEQATAAVLQPLLSVLMAMWVCGALLAHIWASAASAAMLLAMWHHSMLATVLALPACCQRRESLLIALLASGARNSEKRRRLSKAMPLHGLRLGAARHGAITRLRHALAQQPHRHLQASSRWLQPLTPRRSKPISHRRRRTAAPHQDLVHNRHHSQCRTQHRTRRPCRCWRRR